MNPFLGEGGEGCCLRAHVRLDLEGPELEGGGVPGMETHRRKAGSEGSWGLNDSDLVHTPRPQHQVEEQGRAHGAELRVQQSMDWGEGRQGREEVNTLAKAWGPNLALLLASTAV